MLAMTENAGEFLTQMLTEAEASEDVCVRIASKEGQLVLKFDKQGPDDAAYSHEGRTVLVVEEALAQDLQERQIAVEEKESGAHLVLK